MLRQQIYSEAISRIQARRQQAKQEQEARTVKIREEIPETAELDRQLRKVALSVFQAADPSCDRAARLKAVETQSRQAEAMLRNLLTAHGYPADYLDLHYTCPLCDDTGFCGEYPCECLKREVGRIGAEQMNKGSQLSLCGFDSFSMQYYRELPPEQYAVMQKNYRLLRDYAEHFDPQHAGNLLLTGGTGLGKTHLSLAIASTLLSQGYSVIYDAIGNLLHILNQEYFSRSTEKDADTLTLLMECDLLILDDFGTEFDTPFNRSTVYTLINGRINANKPMILSTNLTLAEIQEQYGDRILSRLLTGAVCQFYGSDIRIKKRQTN